jgi:predicted acetyltransferase
VSTEEALETFPTVYDRVFGQRPGLFARSRDWWEIRALADDPDRRGSAGALNRVLLEGDSGPEGYALYRIRQSFDAFTSTGSTIVIEAMGATPEATRALWRWLLDMDWTAEITGERLPLDHPLFHLLAEPRRLRFRVTDSLWVRLVDVGAALSGRGYLGEGEVVFEVTDEFCPWNEGRWRVTPEMTDRTEAAADLRLDAAALGSVYLGGFTFRQLADALRVEELEPGAIARADGLFRAERAPWCVEIF